MLVVGNCRSVAAVAWSRAINEKRNKVGQITKIVRLGRADRALSSPGPVCDFLSGYGVIRVTSGEQYFFAGQTDRDVPIELCVGDQVTFDVELGPLSRAIDVQRMLQGSHASWSDEEQPHHDRQHHDLGHRYEMMLRNEETTESVNAQVMSQSTMNEESRCLSDRQQAEHDAEVRAVLRQTRVEYATLAFVQAALVETMDWRTEGETFSRKLSGLQHCFDMFSEKVKRVFVIEERDGMARLLRDQSDYTDCVELLFAEHRQICEALGELTARLDQCLPFDHSKFNGIQRDIRRVIMQLDDHMHRESNLIMDAFGTDVGVGE